MQRFQRINAHPGDLVWASLYDYQHEEEFSGLGLVMAETRKITARIISNDEYETQQRILINNKFRWAYPDQLFKLN
jgi:hypothetical protein